ncbi:hypothetical protein ACH4UM_23600 [Streptomyces sp. NPDC020801]|uniref:hypothetical protein n=1 Tax=Streptomyces sp. NPDC020801 TaxID=3365093 RepID=UPI003796F40E
MRNFLRQLLDALAHRGPDYDLPTRTETDLRAALADLSGRWEHFADAIDPGLPKELLVDADSGQQWAATVAHTYRVTARDLRDVLRTGLPPHALMTDAELEQHGTPEEAGR